MLFVNKKIDYSSIPDCLFEMQNYSVKQLISKCFFGWLGVKDLAKRMQKKILYCIAKKYVFYIVYRFMFVYLQSIMFLVFFNLEKS